MNYLEINRVVGCLIVISISRSTNGIPVNFTNLANAYMNVAYGVFGNSVAKSSNLIISDGNERSLTVNDFKDELLKRTMIGEIRLVFRQDTSSKISVISGHRKRFATFIIESFDDYREIHKKITTEFFRSHAHIIIVLVNGEILEIDEIFQILWKLQMYNVVVLYEDNEGAVNAKTFFPFQDGLCNCSASVLINRFVDGRFVNGTDNIFQDKLKNLHNCTINVAISDSSAPAVIVEKLSDGTFELHGRDIKLIRTLGKSLNFSINFSFIGEEGYFYANGSSKGPLKALLDGTADLSISDWWMKANRMQYFDESETYIFDTIVFIVPSGVEYTTFEKLAYPFSIGAWLTILAFYAFGFALIFVLELCPDSLRNFVLGRTNNNPHLNMFVAFIGGTQTQRNLPRRNFARYLLMIFLLYSLVIRTAFQGLYYNLLQSSKRHQEVQSLDEIIEKKFELYLFPWMLDVFKDTENLKSRYTRKTFTMWLDVDKTNENFLVSGLLWRQKWRWKRSLIELLPTRFSKARTRCRRGQLCITIRWTRRNNGWRFARKCFWWCRSWYTPRRSFSWCLKLMSRLRDSMLMDWSDCGTTITSTGRSWWQPRQLIPKSSSSTAWLDAFKSSHSAVSSVSSSSSSRFVTEKLTSRLHHAALTF